MEEVLFLYIDPAVGKKYEEIWNLYISTNKTHSLILNDVSQLISLLAVLDSDTKFYLFVHIGQFIETEHQDKFYIGGDIGKELKEIFSGLNYCFVTRSSKESAIAKLGTEVPVYEYKELPTIISKNIFPYNIVKEIRMTKEYKSCSYRFIDEADWRIMELPFGVDDNEFREILGESLKAFETDDVIVQLLNQGLSGSFVFRVDFKVGKENFSRLIKIGKSKELYVKELNQNRELKKLYPDTNMFIRVVDESYFKLHDWYCLVFSFAVDKIPLRKYLKENIVIKNSDCKAAMDYIFNGLFGSIGAGAYLVEKIYPWRAYDNGKTIYKGLDYVQEDRILILKGLSDIINFFSNDFWNDILDNKPESLKYLHKFIVDQQYDLYSPDSKVSDIPVSRVHGDLNSGNVMINDKNIGQFSFIDFSNTSLSHDQNALIDVGKMAVDLEKYCLPDLLLFSDRNLLTDWIDYHDKWLNNSIDPSILVNESITSIYSLISHLKQIAIRRCKQIDHNFPDQKIELNFLLVRLYYLLRNLSNNRLTIEKRLFSVLAAIQTLNYMKLKNL